VDGVAFDDVFGDVFGDVVGDVVGDVLGDVHGGGVGPVTVQFPICCKYCIIVKPPHVAQFIFDTKICSPWHINFAIH